jgi:hypothetical protein
MWGYGDYSGTSPTATWSPATSTAFFGYGYGDPDPDDLFDAAGGALTWAGTEVDWGYGGPAQLEADHILWASSQRLPDDGGEIIELRAEWPTTGPWRVKMIQGYTATTFPLASSPLPYCSSPVPGFAERCYTNEIEVEELGTLVTKPGSILRFVLPVLPTGSYDVKLEADAPGLLNTTVTLEGVCEVIYRNRAVETYSFRRRFPQSFTLGVREISTEPLLGVHSDATGDEELP